MRKPLGVTLVLLSLSTAFILRALPVCAQETTEPQKLIFAHYMGCFPLDKFTDGKSYFKKVDHTKPDYENAIGGRYCNLALQPDRDSFTLAPEHEGGKNGLKNAEIEAAAIDIRRAIRAGLDGFAVDVLAGREVGVHTMHALFAAAEKYDLPFMITFCLDNHYRNPSAIKLILDSHGDSPKLARRNGKPLFFGYYSGRDAQFYLTEYLDRQKTGKQTVPEDYYKNTRFAGMPVLERDTMDFPELSSVDQLWTTPAGFAAHAKAFRHYEQVAGTPLHLQFELSHFLRGTQYAAMMDVLKNGVGILADGFDSLGNFMPTTYLTDDQVVDMAALVRSKGCEWGEAMNYQYDNQMWQRYHVGKTVENIEHRWQMVERTGATILQFTTWNDYAENTQLAPANETRYTYLELNSYFVHKWKTGAFPVYDDDRIFALYHKYPKGAEATCYPFYAARYTNSDNLIEVVTILTKPATVRLVGRGQEWQAPAGYSVHRAPGTPGEVKVEIVRDGAVAKALDCPEPITDRIYREQVTPTCFSTEFMKNWKIDFGDLPPVTTVGWYADNDKDGLPNWFEMYWFGTFGDFSTCTAANPSDDPDGDGLTNLQEYERGTNPREANTVAPANFAWDLIKDTPKKLTFNPDRDTRDNKVWYYGCSDRTDAGLTQEAFRQYRDLNRRPGDKKSTTYHQFNDYDRNLYPYGTATQDPTIPASAVAHDWDGDTHSVELLPTAKDNALIAWKSPEDMTVTIEVEYTTRGKGEGLRLVAPDGNSSALAAGSPNQFTVQVKQGQMLFLMAPPAKTKSSYGLTALRIVKQ